MPGDSFDSKYGDRTFQISKERERSNLILLADLTARRNGRWFGPRLPQPPVSGPANRLMVLEVMRFSRANNEFARVIHRSVNRSLIDRIIRCGNASVRENTRNSARSFRVSPLCLQTSGFCPSLLGLHFSSHSLLVCPPVPSSRRFFTVLPHRSLSHSFFLFLFVFLVSLLTPSPTR